MRERAIRFGSSAGLSGILTEPAAGTATDRPVVVLLNSGILHRVGPCRLHVTLARDLAEDGWTTLRFDFSGIGDSEGRKDDLSFDESAVAETREAMDYLAARKGVQTFVVGGLCSGADMGFHVTAADDRVVGLVQLDAWAYRTFGYHVHYYLRRIPSLAAWKRYLGIRAARLAGRLSGAGNESQTGVGEDFELPRYVRVFPPREQVEARLREFVERRIRLLCVFSGEQDDVYNHQGQYRASFRKVPFGDLLQVEYMREADHIFTGLRDQAKVSRLVRDWMRTLSHAAVTRDTAGTDRVRAAPALRLHEVGT